MVGRRDAPYNICRQLSMMQPCSCMCIFANSLPQYPLLARMSEFRSNRLRPLMPLGAAQSVAQRLLAAPKTTRANPPSFDPLSPPSATPPTASPPRVYLHPASPRMLQAAPHAAAIFLAPMSTPNARWQLTTCRVHLRLITIRLEQSRGDAKLNSRHHGTVKLAAPVLCPSGLLTRTLHGPLSLASSN